MDDHRSLMYVGKVRHKFTNVTMDPIKLCFNAMAEEYGVFNLNQMNLDIQITAEEESVEITLQ